MEGDELYGDLETANLNIDLEKATSRCIELEKQLKAVEQELVQCRQHSSQVSIEKDQLEKNMIILYNTALLEISRKDKELADLRFQIAKRNS